MSETAKQVRRQVEAARLSGSGSNWNAGASGQGAAGVASNAIPSTRRDENGNTKRLFVLNVDTLNDSRTYLGSEPVFEEFET